MTDETDASRPTRSRTVESGSAEPGSAGPDRTRRSLLGGAGLLLGGGAALAAGGTAAAAPAEEPMQQGRDADAGRPTEHRQAYYRLARF